VNRPTPILRVLSLGGGTQSCALALMSAAGDLPKLDHVVFADTQGELPETYAYLDYLRPILDTAGIPLHVVTAGNLYDDLTSATPTSSNPTPPVHLRMADGSKGRLGQYRCSYDYKRRIIDRAVRQLCGGRGVWKKAHVEQWIGFSADEIGRMKQTEECRCGHKRVGMTRTGERVQRHTADGCILCDCPAFDPWQINRWPLIELRMKRDDTIRWFGAHGHPTPPRSACWFCPNSGNDRWRILRSDHPDLFERAAVLDESIRHGDSGFNKRGNVAFRGGEMFLHGSLTPLRDADLRSDAQRRSEDDGQDALFDADALGMDCEAGVCFT
jgi:hypothetical protein